MKKFVTLIVDAADELNNELDVKIPTEQGKDAPLFGRDGVLDSLGLVNLVVAVEQAIEDEFGISVVLADEKALSLVNSPYRTIGSLAEHAKSLILEDDRQWID